MAFIHGKGAGLLLGAFNLSPYLNTNDTEIDVDMPETTTYGAGAKTYLPGIKDGKTSIGGFVDNTPVVGSDAVLSSALGMGAVPLTVCPQGLSAIGNLAKLSVTNPANYKLGTPVGGVVSFTADLTPTGGIWSGQLLEPLTQKTNLGNSASSVDNLTASTSGGVANYHVTAVTSGTATAKVQHSTDNSTWVDLISFTASSATTSEEKTVTGTVNRYTRAAWTGTFVQSFAISFARF